MTLRKAIEKMDKIVLAASSYYKQSYFLEESQLPSLPESVSKELKGLLIEACEETKGVVLLGFYVDGEVFVEAVGDENDFAYDEIGARLYINAFIKNESDFLYSLSLWYKHFCTEK